jgi:hypothetical protein
MIWLTRPVFIETLLQTLRLAAMQGNPATLRLIKKTLIEAGVEFIAENGGGAGVRLRQAKR